MLASPRCNMDKKIRISIMVGEVRYPLWVDPKEEPIFREAGRRLNQTLIEYRKKFRGTGRTNEDLLAMTLIDLSVLLQRKESEATPETTESELAAMVADLQSFLDNDDSEQC